jgi:hypothetical protein
MTIANLASTALDSALSIDEIGDFPEESGVVTEPASPIRHVFTMRELKTRGQPGFLAGNITDKQLGH